MSLDFSIIQVSFEKMRPVVDEAAGHFFETLFTKFPESKSLFRSANLEEQKKVWTDSLVKIVEGLSDLPSLTHSLRSIGKRNADSGVKEEHYSMVGKSLITTLKTTLKDQWTAELEDQWILAIGFVADQILEGAFQAGIQDKEVAPEDPIGEIVELKAKTDSHELSQVVRQIARNLLLKALEEEINGDFSKTARKKAAQVLTQAIKDEAEKLQSQFQLPKKKTA